LTLLKFKALLCIALLPKFPVRYNLLGLRDGLILIGNVRLVSDSHKMFGKALDVRVNYYEPKRTI
jgi:hypothetical protein